MLAQPLQNVRILDVCAYLAGPFAVTLLAHLGAEIVKVESIQRLDYLRLMGGYPQPDGYEWSPAFNAANLNKYGITLNLNHPRGIEIFKQLVALSDVVTENFSPRVMDNWGLSYDQLKEINPSIIMLSMPGFGRTGPWRNYVTFGPNVEMLAGIPTISGYPDGPPLMNGYTADPFASMAGATAVMVALQYRHRTAKGQHIDMSQIEATTSFMGEYIIGYSINRKLRPRKGNRHSYMAPQGVYPCKGEDEWVAITVSSEEKWLSFCGALGNPSWTREARFSNAQSRQDNHDELDSLIELWTSQRDKYEATRILQEAHIAAAPVLNCSELVVDPHMQQRGFFKEITHPATGIHRYPGFPVRFSETPLKTPGPAPTLGQHNEYVFKTLLKMTDKEIDKLTEEQIIGVKPQGWPYSEEPEQQDDSGTKLFIADGGAGITKAVSEK